MLTSIISTPAAESFSHISPYSSGVFPEMLAMIFTSCLRSSGSSWAIKSSTPGFWSPTELRMPMGVSAMRGAGLPSRGWGVRPLTQMAPSSLRSKNCPYSRPKPKVPEGTTMGFLSSTPARVTF